MHAAVPIGIAIDDLRPTQMTVGLREVEEKRRHWHAADEAGRARLLRRHVLPAVIGPKGRPYIVDHHHFARALLMEKAGPVAVYILADLSSLAKAEFWTFLDNSAWCHAYDDEGRRCALSDIPRKLGDLKDDPFRSLVGALIRGGGIAKSSKPLRRIPVRRLSAPPARSRRAGGRFRRRGEARAQDRSTPGCGQPPGLVREESRRALSVPVRTLDRAP